jgi:hypothetical protein
LRWDQRTQQLLIDAPVHEEELAPTLMHDRLAFRAPAHGEMIEFAGGPIHGKMKPASRTESIYHISFDISHLPFAVGCFVQDEK